ncbi:hypothetical protein TrST_g636 [Triparma strigata]|uniref:Glutaminase n=2 Tax=Triparma strigata TaxID=1606541 RepID=A0A9W7B1Y2_9STRA|nr:hypothetical protein TrST_g636 [Triparma strigata]
MGPQNVSGINANNVEQINVIVKPTTTVYTFMVGEMIKLEIKFTSPFFQLDEDVGYNHLPTNYVTYTVESSDGGDHDVEVYFDVTGEGIVHPSEEIEMRRGGGEVESLRIGGTEQDVLGGTGDRINWGYFYLNVGKDAEGVATSLSSDVSCRSLFYNHGYLPDDDDNLVRKVNDNWPVMAVKFDLNVEGNASNSNFLTLTMDEVKSMDYFGTEVLPWWKTIYEKAEDMIEAGFEFYEQVIKDTEAYDEKLIEEFTEVGGEKYSDLLSLVHRQTTGATAKTTSPIDGEPWHWMKEISSDGDVSTVDVIYPAAPFFLYLAPETLRRMFMPLLFYANNSTGATSEYDYDLPWAPHHLGVWPICDILASDQEQMPVEESGNFLIMLAATAKAQNNSIEYLSPYWPLLKAWADYNVASLPDPGDQLCTDDFEGPSPHNVNLAAKGIVGLGAYAMLLEMKGDAEGSEKYMNIAKDLVGNWTEMGVDVDGSHTRLQFNLDDTWSLKYNLFFDVQLGLNLFPQDIIEYDLKHYDSLSNEYGVPLDSRGTFTKADWLMWVYSLGTEEQLNAQVEKLWKFADETEDRVPFTDWYDTVSAKQQGFQARPVMGGIYAKMLL